MVEETCRDSALKLPEICTGPNIFLWNTVGKVPPFRGRGIRKKEQHMRLNGLAAGAGLAMVLVLAGCGTRPGDRALSGAAIGAGAGAIIGAATGTPATGAAIGAAAGAAIGGLTDPCDINLGDPYWKQNGGKRAYDRRCGKSHHHRDRDRYDDRY